MSDGLMSPHEAARFLSVSRGTVYNMLAANELPSLALGRSRRIPRRAVIDLAARLLRGGGIQR